MMDPAIETESLLGTSVAISISKKSDHTNGELLKESASETIKCERDPKRKIGRCFKVGSIDEGCVSDADFEAMIPVYIEKETHQNGLQDSDSGSEKLIESNGHCGEHEEKDRAERSDQLKSIIDCSKCRHISLTNQSLLYPPNSDQSKVRSPLNKSVTFADNHGHKLSHVLSFDNLQEVDCTLHDSWEDFEEYNMGSANRYENSDVFAPLFYLPPSSAAREKAQTQKIKLESIQIFGFRILGAVLVSNLGYHKEVAIRYTLDHWDTFDELEAVYVKGSENQGCERFSFEYEFNRDHIEDKVVFCLRYKCDAGEFWDNNHGMNYSLKLLKT